MCLVKVEEFLKIILKCMPQVTVKNFTPVCLMVALIASLWMIISAKFGIIAWVPFISWALYFIAGSKLSRLPKEAIALTGGIIIGYIVLLLIPKFIGIFGGTFGVPVIVFIAAFVIVMLELTDWFELAPAYFFSFATYFAAFFGTSGATPFSMIWPVWLPLMIGLLLGVITAELRKRILLAQGVPLEQQQTVFDKEKKL